MAMSATEARHLLRRTGFGVDSKELDRILTDGEERAAAVDRLLDFTPKRFKPGGREIDDVQNKWIKYLLKARNQLQEKLVLFWHDHFATNFATVGDAKLMAFQNRLFRENCIGNFKTLVKLVNKDPAMMEMLDTVRNKKNKPNENYARELMELFMLGVFDSSGTANYEQADIVQIARAFTGWDYDGNEAFLNDNQHDFGTDKLIFANVGQFPAAQSITGAGTGAIEIDNVIEILAQHRDSATKNTCARYLTTRLIEYFAHPNPTTTYIDAVILDANFDTAFELKPLLREIFIHDDFYLSAAGPPYAAGSKKSVKWPIDFVIGTMRMLEMKFKGRDLTVEGGDYTSIRGRLIDMGQLLLEPPSVFGWDLEQAWLSSATFLARFSFARDVSTARDGKRSSFRPELLMDLALTDPGAIVDAAANVLGIPDQLDTSLGGDRDILIAYLTDEGAVPQLNLLDPDVRNAKLGGLFALLMQSPAYQLH